MMIWMLTSCSRGGLGGWGGGREIKKISYENVGKVIRNNGKIKKKLKKNFQGVKWVMEKHVRDVTGSSLHARHGNNG